MDDCSICIEKIKNNECSPFTCNHMFHKKCILKWNGSCPYCRSQRIDENAIKQIETEYNIKLSYDKKIKITHGYDNCILLGNFKKIHFVGGKSFIYLENITYIKKNVIQKTISNFSNILFNHKACRIHSITCC